MTLPGPGAFCIERLIIDSILKYIWPAQNTCFFGVYAHKHFADGVFHG